MGGGRTPRLTPNADITGNAAREMSGRNEEMRFLGLTLMGTLDAKYENPTEVWVNVNAIREVRNAPDTSD